MCKMYAVVNYDDYRKEVEIEIIAATHDVEYAKKIAFNKIKEKMSEYKDYNEDELYKIETNIETEYFEITNKEIISYRIIKVKKCENKFKKLYHSTNKYAVVEIPAENTQNIKEIDTSLICDNYVMDS